MNLQLTKVAASGRKMQEKMDKHQILGHYMDDKLVLCCHANTAYGCATSGIGSELLNT